MQTPRPLRITFVLPLAGLEGGVRVVATYARLLHERGHKVTVASCSRVNRPGAFRLRRKTRDILDRLTHPFSGRPATNGTHATRRASHLDEIPHLHRLLDTGGPVTASHLPDADVVIATWWETAWWVANLPASKGSKIHFVQHDERVFTEDPQIRRRIGETWRLPGFRRIAVAEWIANAGRQEFGVECEVASNAVDTKLFDAPPRSRQASPTFALMYSRVRFKGVDVSLEAYRLARREVPDLRLVAFGAYPPEPSLPLPEGAVYHQNATQNQIAGVYASADAYLFGSRCEGFGLPLLESMACRTPVIGTPTGAAPELLEGGGGRLVPIDDPEAMARAIVEMARMPEEQWRVMSDAAYATAREHDWGRATDHFESLLAAAAVRR